MCVRAQLAEISVKQSIAGVLEELQNRARMLASSARVMGFSGPNVPSG